MLMIILLTLLLTLLTYIYMRWIQLKQFWAKRNISYIPPNPLVGSLTFLLKENPALWFRRMYNYCNDPYVGIWVFWQPGILVNSREIARNILIRDQANFRNRYANSGTTDPVGRLNLFTLNDPLWSVIRRRLSVMFTGSKLRGLQELITEKSKELVKRIENERQKPEPVNIRIIMTDFTTDVIGTSSFGVISDATLTGNSSLRKITDDFAKFDIIRGMAWCSVFFIPKLVDYFRFKMFPVENMREMIREIIAQRGGLDNKVTEPRDLLDILIKIKQEGDEELNMTEEMMIAQAAVFLQGGFEASAVVLSLAVYELAFCPEAQDKLYKELQQAKDKYGDKALHANVLSQLTYLNCVINETLRKYPPMGWMDRVALEDYQIDENLIIEAGTPVYVNVIGMHYDPDFYPEPEKFIPERFLPHNESSIQSFTFLPFGEGPRKCIGQRFGLSTARHGLASTILNYVVTPLPNATKPSNVKFDKKALFIAPCEILLLNFVPRT